MSSDEAGAFPAGATAPGASLVEARPAVRARPADAVPLEAWLLALATFCFIAATNLMTPLLPMVKDDFGVSIATAGVIVGSYGLARLLADLPAGFLAERIGHRRLTVFGIVLLIVSSLVGWTAANVGVLILARIGSGIAVALLAVVSLTAMSATTTAASRAKVLSLFGIANNTGIAVYPMIGGVVGTVVGWRPTFLVTAVLAVVAAAILTWVLPRIDFSQARKTTGRDDPGRVLTGRRRTVTTAVTNATVVASMIHRHGVRNTILPLYAAAALGLGGVSIATAVALMAITGLVVSMPGGMLSDRIGRRRVLVSGLMAIAVGDLAFLLTHDLASFLLVAALVGLGDFYNSSQTALLAEIVPAAERTRTLSVYRFSSDLGAMIGPILLAAVMDVFSAQAAIVLAAAILATTSIAARLLVPGQVDRREPAALAA